MATVNEILRDLELRHEIRLRRYSNGLLRRINRLLNQADARLTARITERIAAGPIDTFTTARLQGVLDEVRTINAQVVGELHGQVRAGLEALSADEIDFQMRTLSRAAPIEFNWQRPSLDLVRASVTAEPFRGRLMREWFADLEESRFKRMRDTVRIGVVDGSSVPNMVRDLRAFLDIDRAKAEAIVRTAVNHITNSARDKVMQANDDILKGWQFVATLDARTTPMCQQLDGQVFPIGEGPKPPRHPNCRSVMVPLTKSWKELGLAGLDKEAQVSERPFVRDERRVSEIPAEERDQLIGRVPAKTTYQEWLSAQDAEFQDEVLGPTRGKLFREGGLTLDRFADDSRQYTLDELRRREAAAFKKAGL